MFTAFRARIELYNFNYTLGNTNVDKNVCEEIVITVKNCSTKEHLERFQRIFYGF